MTRTIGIRREDKSEWERRTPVAPREVEALAEQGVAFCVQPSEKRAFPLGDYKEAGSEVSAELNECSLVAGVKEIPLELLRPETTYLYFSHTIKGQSYNMPALKRLMELGCDLIDYEKVEDDKGRRLIFFGRHAGLAGMIDTLWALGKRLKEHENVETPFQELSPAHGYTSLEEGKKAVQAVGERIQKEGLPAASSPFVCGFAGYGNVSGGAQEIFDLLGGREVSPEELLDEDRCLDPNGIYKVVFKEKHLVEPVDAGASFELQEYYDYPERYRGVFARFLPHLSVLMNCVYWEDRYPRLVTREALKGLMVQGPVSLKVIGDISCDVAGGVEATVKATQPDDPVFVYDPQSAKIAMGFKGPGVAILAVDNLPCELSREASLHFSASLGPYLKNLAETDFEAPLEALPLAAPLKRALIVHRGKLTPDFQYLQEFVSEAGEG